MAGTVVAAAAGPLAIHLAGETGRVTGQADALSVSTTRPGPAGRQPAASPVSTPLLAPGHYRARHAKPAASPSAHSRASAAGLPVHHRHRRPVPAPPVYANPFRAVSGLIPERVDQGVDFGGSGPVYAIGDGVITNATGNSPGWPGGGWITYQLTKGPAAGLEVYVAEDVTPTVQVGQHVTSSTQIATMFNGGDGIETGWAQPGGLSAESQLPVAGGISGGGPFPTMVGLNFEGLLQSLAVPASPYAGGPGSGLLPSNYPSHW